MKKGLVLIAIAAIALACSPAPSTAPASSAAPAAGDSFSRFVDDYFDARFDYLPSQGTDAGFHQYDQSRRTRTRKRGAEPTTRPISITRWVSS